MKNDISPVTKSAAELVALICVYHSSGIAAGTGNFLGGAMVLIAMGEGGCFKSGGP
jgi:hypothetical protein